MVSQFGSEPPSALSALQDLVHTLRAELLEYGEWLALLEEQDDVLGNQTLDELVRSMTHLRRQRVIVDQAREHRERCQQTLAWVTGLLEDTPWPRLLQTLPPDSQPLLAALTLEKDHCRHRAQERSRHTHLRLSRSIQTLEQLLGSLSAHQDWLGEKQNRE